MALPKKGTRKITVDNIDYRWIVSPRDEVGLGIVVESIDCSGSRMTTWVEHGNIISPWLVRKAIKNAISKRWQPHKSGNQFEFRFEGILSKEEDDFDA